MRACEYAINELLSYPECLKDPYLDSCFTKFIYDALQNLPLLSLPSSASVLHGLLLLSLHKSQVVREWCLSLINEVEQKLSSDTLIPNFELIPIVSDFIRYDRVPNSFGYKLTDKIELYANAFEMLFIFCEDSALNSILRDYEDFQSSFLVYLLNSTSNFRSSLELLERLIPLSNFCTQNVRAIWSNILNHKEFKVLASENKNLSLSSRRIFFDWILDFLTKSMDNVDLLPQLQLELVNWASPNQEYMAALLVTLYKHAEDSHWNEDKMFYIVRTIISGFSIAPHKHSIQVAEKGFLLNLQALNQAFASNTEPSFPVVSLWQTSALNTVSHRYQLLALRAYTEVGFLGHLNVSKALQIVANSIDDCICSILEQFLCKNQEEQHIMLNELQERDLGLVIMTSQSVSEKTLNLIKISTKMS